MLANSEFASKSLIFADFFIYKSEVHVVSSNFFLFQIQWWLKKESYALLYSINSNVSV